MTRLGRDALRLADEPSFLDNLRACFGQQRDVCVYVMNNAYTAVDMDDVNPVARRDTIRLTDHEREFKRRRLAVYNFLDHPRSASNFPYHFGIFVFVLCSVVLGALADTTENRRFTNIAFVMEAFLAIFFIVEFIVRIWSVGADAKFKGFRGLLRYLVRPVCLIDILIIVVTFSILFIDRVNNRGIMLDVLRFIQILRLFHIDRQMTTWNMILKMTTRSLFELTAAYYISSLLFMVLACTVYEVEITAFANKVNKTEGEKATFENYGDAMWFSVVSFLTIGYGDIVPKHWLSKVVTCVMAYAAYCTFVASSTLVSVGMTLMMENETKDKQKGKVRQCAASVIQHWYRYHLATDRKEAWNTIPYFKHVCYKLYLADERIKRSRMYEEQMREKIEKAQTKRKISKAAKEVAKHRTLDDLYSDAPGGKDEHPKPLVRKVAALRKISLLHRSGSAPDERALKKEVSIVSHKHSERRGSGSTSMSSSVDLSDVERQMDLYMFESHSFDSKRPSCDINMINEEVLQKYRPLIRFFNFLLFQRCLKKFAGVRKPWKLLDAETELCEMEHNRNQLFHELELKLEATIGKPAQSPFVHSDAKVSIERRLDACEQYVAEMDAKVQELIRLAEGIAEAVGCADELREEIKTQRDVIETIDEERRRRLSDLRKDSAQLAIERYERWCKAESRRQDEAAVAVEAGELPEDHVYHTVPKRSVCRTSVNVYSEEFFSECTSAEATDEHCV